MSTRKTILWAVVAIAAGAAIAAVYLRLQKWKPRLSTIQGAVIRADKNPDREVPVADAVVTVSRGPVTVSTRSDTSGYFHVLFPQVIWPGQTITVTFRQPDYHPLDMNLEMAFRSSARRLIVAEMKPLAEPVQAPTGKPAQVVSNIRIRYTVNSESEENIGSAVRTFQVANQANVPCRHQGPCSPDGVWKAAAKSITLDAGQGNEFRDVRASCVAGPCPFTRIETHGADHGGRTVVITALDWSDTTTFLVEAAVFRTSLDSNVRESYPVLLDRNLNFTLPATQEGVSIEAEVAGTPMVFPLGPDIYLSWATCNMRINGGSKSEVYQCQLKPGYRF